MKNSYVFIYANEVTNVFTDDIIESIDMFEIELPRKILFNFFKDKCSPYYETDEVSFKNWLTEYTADDTIGLWGYAKQHGTTPLIYNWWK